MFRAKVSEKSTGKMKSRYLLAVFLVPLVALILGAATPQAWAGKFADAKIIFETNFSDRDTGIQIILDGEPWKEVEIKGPNGEILEVEAEGKLRRFGLTELFFESNEPNWDDMPLEDILALFPEGNYKFKGETTKGSSLRGNATLSHELPCAPDEDALFPSEVSVSSAEAVTISWYPVTNKLDNAAEECSEDDEDEIEVETYQIIVENFQTESDFSIFLPALEADNQVTLPAEFITPGTVYKYEVLAIAENGNQTIVETFFCTDLDPCPEPE